MWDVQNQHWQARDIQPIIIAAKHVQLLRSRLPKLAENRNENDATMNLTMTLKNQLRKPTAVPVEAAKATNMMLVP
jgi:hypothetical protein